MILYILLGAILYVLGGIASAVFAQEVSAAICRLENEHRDGEDFFTTNTQILLWPMVLFVFLMLLVSWLVARYWDKLASCVPSFSLVNIVARIRRRKVKPSTF